MMRGFQFTPVSHEKTLDSEAKMPSYYSGIWVGGPTFLNNMKLLQENQANQP